MDKVLNLFSFIISKKSMDFLFTEGYLKQTREFNEDLKLSENSMINTKLTS